MASAKFSRREFEKDIKISKEIEKKISMLGTHLENLNNGEIEIEVNPNRPDLFSLHGFIRALKAFLGKQKGLKEYKTNPPKKDYEVKIDKSVSEVRPYTVCAIIKDLKFDDGKIKEVIDIQEKIHTTYGRNRKKIAIGIYPLEKISLPIKFQAKYPKDIKFIPLESNQEMNGLEILQKHPVGKDYGYLLEGKEKFPVFIDAEKEILSMPPIINSHKTGKITGNTKEIFIECSGFDLNALKKTLNILVTMFADLGGKVYQMRIKSPEGTYITPDLNPEKMKLNINNVNQLLGLKLKENEIKNYLERMGYNYNKGIAEIPPWRTDILHEVDLIEDIAIAYGDDKFKPEIPNISFTGKENSAEIKRRKISEILVGLGLLEISSYHLTTEENQFKNMGLKKEKVIEVENSKTEYNILRQNLLHYSLKTLSKNVDTEYPQKIYELGKIFSLDTKEETGIREDDNLCICISGQNCGFTEIKQIFDYLMRMMKKNYTIQIGERPFFISGRCIKVNTTNKTIGLLGEISPQILSNLKIKMPVAALEIDIAEIIGD